MENNNNISPDWGPTAWSLFSKVRNQSPLVQCITNFVSMDLVANTLLSVGASPAMLHSVEEIPDFTPQIQALYINVGTLSPDWLPSMKAAAVLASRLGKPWVLDPVAAGASSFRLNACLELVGLKPTVIRGNGSEIISLFKASMGNTKGVDSYHESMDALEAAKSLAQTSGSIVAVSGATDIITDGDRVIGARNGVSMLQKITATGCSVTALIAAFVAVDPLHPLAATASALSIFGVAAEKGLVLANGPASLRMHLIDSLYRLDEDGVRSLKNNYKEKTVYSTFSSATQMDCQPEQCLRTIRRKLARRYESSHLHKPSPVLKLPGNTSNRQSSHATPNPIYPLKVKAITIFTPPSNIAVNAIIPVDKPVANGIPSTNGIPPFGFGMAFRRKASYWP